MTLEQAQREADKLNNKARKQGRRKKYVVVETFLYGVVVAERNAI